MHGKGNPVVVLTKADLVDDFTDKVRAVDRIAADVGVYAVSAKTGYGIDRLSEYLKPRKTIVFLGSSGVGKSSLVNALAGEEIMTVNEIREDDSKGRHTTTHRQLIMLKSGVMIIDTPGMRELGMWDVSDGLAGAFDDVSYLDDASSATAATRPNQDVLSRQRLPVESSRSNAESYMQLKQEAKFADNKAGFLQKSGRGTKTLQFQKQNKSGLQTYALC